MRLERQSQAGVPLDVVRGKAGRGLHVDPHAVGAGMDRERESLRRLRRSGGIGAGRGERAPKSVITWTKWGWLAQRSISPAAAEGLGG